MQKSENTKGRKKQFAKAFSYIDYSKDEKRYFGKILFYEKGKKLPKRAALEIRIDANNKADLKEQMRRIEKLYPSDKNTITVDMEMI